MRFLIAVIFFLGLSLQVLGQTLSDTGSIPASVTGAPTGTASVTWTSTGTWTRSGSGTGTWTASASITGTATGSGTPTQTYPQPAAPINVVNFCGTPGHITIICPTFEDPPTHTFNLYRIWYTLQGSGVVNFVLTNLDQINIVDLVPASVYDVFVQGVDTNVGVWSANSTTVQMITLAADPKKDPTRDIQGFACSQTTSPEGRGAIACSWTAAADTVRQINFKIHCVTTGEPTREPLLVRKRKYGTNAAITSIQFNINRDRAHCNVYAHFFYQRRPTTRRHVVVNLV